MRAIPARAVDFTSQWEGWVAKAYPDPATGGAPWTIGWGHTGPEVKPGLVITKVKGRALLKEDLKKAAVKIYACVKAEIIEALSEEQWSALLSFVFNLGANKSWTLWKVLNAGRFHEVPAQLMRFVNAAGRRMQGLANRRAAEVALWNSGEVEDYVPPSSVTRSSPTPPTPTNSKPVAQSNSFMATAAGATATGAASIAAVSDSVRPFAFDSEAVGRVIAILAVLGALLTIAGAVFVWMSKRQANR